MTKKQITGYSAGAKFFHWFIALITILMLSASYFLTNLPDQYLGSAFMLHKSFGITVLFLMLIRLFWIGVSGKPALPARLPSWQKYLSRFVQYALYLTVILMPLSGWIMSTAANKIPYFFGLFHFSLPGIEPNKHLSALMKQTHNTLAWIIIALLVLHIAGAIKHHFIDKDNVLDRMLPGR